MERNFETVMIEQCSPVLAGLKAAGLFRYETQDCKDLAERVRGWNARLGEKASGPGSQGLHPHPPVSGLCLPGEPPARSAFG